MNDDSTIDQQQTKMLKCYLNFNESYFSSSSLNVLDISLNSDEQPIQPIINIPRRKICEKQVTTYFTKFMDHGTKFIVGLNIILFNWM